MSLFSTIKDAITGNSTVQHNEHLGGHNEASGKGAHGSEVYVSQMNGQTIVRTHDHTVIMNGEMGGDAYNKFSRTEDQHHRVDLGMAEKLKDVVGKAMRDGTITKEEFARIEQTTEQVAESRPSVPNHGHAHGHQGGRG